MSLQEKAKKVMASKLTEMLDFHEEVAEILASEIIDDLEENHFFIQYDWESADKDV